MYFLCTDVCGIVIVREGGINGVEFIVVFQFKVKCDFGDTTLQSYITLISGTPSLLTNRQST